MKKQKKRSFLAKIRRWFVLLSLLWFFLTFSLVLSLRWFDPPTTAFMLQRLYSDDAIELQHEWRPLSRIAPSLPMSIIASEDQKFADHHGFDVAERQAGKSMRGASTISQQLAKNVFLWPGRSWVRKGLEVYFTAAIEILIPKRRILELYVNVVEFGDGVYGVEAAAQTIFGVSANVLTSQQSALLAARLPAPKRYVIQPPSQYMHQRARWIQQQVKQLGGKAYLERL